MRLSLLLGISMIALGLVLTRELRKRKEAHQIINGVVIHPTAIFVLQGHSNHPKIDLSP